MPKKTKPQVKLIEAPTHVYIVMVNHSGMNHPAYFSLDEAAAKEVAKGWIDSGFAITLQPTALDMDICIPAPQGIAPQVPEGE